MLLQLLYMGLQATLWIRFLRLPFLGGTLPNPGWPADCRCSFPLWADLWDACILHTHPGKADVTSLTLVEKVMLWKMGALSFLSSTITCISFCTCVWESPGEPGKRGSLRKQSQECPDRNASWQSLSGEQSGSVWGDSLFDTISNARKVASTEQRTPDTLYTDLPLI